MRWSIRVALLAGIFAGLSAPTLAVIHLAVHDGFGASDLSAFALWSTFFAALVATLASPVLRLAGRRRRVVAGAWASLAGLAAGVFFTAVAALALGPWVGAFSFPILYIWAAAGALGLALAAWLQPPPAAELVAHRPRLGRVFVRVALVLLVALAFPFIMLWGSIYLGGRAEHEIHLLPAGYVGPVVIIFGDASGAPEQWEEKARLYAIPPEGVLRTRFAPNPGWSAPDYYYVGSGGQRAPIVRGAPCADSLPGDPVQACLMPSMYVGNRPAPSYSSYVVGREANREALSARWDSVVHWVVFGDSAYRAPQRALQPPSARVED